MMLRALGNGGFSAPPPFSEEAKKLAEKQNHWFDAGPRWAAIGGVAFIAGLALTSWSLSEG